MRCRHDRGQAAVLVVVIAFALGVAMIAALVDFGGITQDRARAQTAADAAALASLDGGRAAAVDFAARHGASVVTWSRGPGDHEVTVIVRVGDSTRRLVRRTLRDRADRRSCVAPGVDMIA